MTHRLYYTDAYATEFEADVIAADAFPDGRTGVVLDRTAFYPTSGGQPFDTGTLGSARVVDVLDREDGTILHVIDGAAPVGHVAGRLDWGRRFEHMQQHTGQHLLSSAFVRAIGVETVGFHLGSTASTIDLARVVTPSEVGRAEDLANEIVWEDRPVTVRFVAERDAATLPLRKEPVRAGPLRIVEIDGFDVSACGGTHVARTGSVGLVAVAAAEKFRGGTRLEFVCGVRALRTVRSLRDSVAAAVRLTSTGPGDLARAIEQLQSDNRELRRQARETGERLASWEAEGLAARAVDHESVRLVLEALDADPDGLKALARRIAARPGHAAVLVSRKPPLSLVVARAEDVPLDAGSLVKEIAARFGGRGGGRAELAQAGGLDAPPEAVLAAVPAHLPISRTGR